MPISKDLFLAILSMDSYNRGYGKGLGLKYDATGLAVLEFDSENVFRDPGADPVDLSPAADAGFYAVAYKIGEGIEGVASGATVISFRGTDSKFDDKISGGSDVWNGWVTGAGSLGAQARLALQFYDQVRAANPDSQIIVTGHSLGGGPAHFH